MEEGDVLVLPSAEVDCFDLVVLGVPELGGVGGVVTAVDASEVGSDGGEVGLFEVAHDADERRGGVCGVIFRYTRLSVLKGGCAKEELTQEEVVNDVWSNDVLYFTELSESLLCCICEGSAGNQPYASVCKLYCC